MKPTYSNDRKAPRMKKGEFSKMVITRELFKRFQKEFPEYKNMVWEDFFNSWLEIAEKIRLEAIHNPLGVKLGNHCGELKMQYLPYKFKAKNYRDSELQGEHVDNANIPQRGKVPKIKWERRWAVKFNKVLQFYAFDQTREINKIAYKYMQDNFDKLRVSRVVIGGFSVWRQKMKKQ